MFHHQPDRPSIIFLFSDTGGGHRSAAEAIIEAIQAEFPDQVTCTMIDLFRQYAPPPLDLAPEMYPPLSRMPHLWRLGYRVSDNPRRTHAVYNAVWPYVRVSLNRLVRENPCDLIVSVHPLANSPVLRALQQNGQQIPFITVVTDMVSVHASWYDPRAELVIVPTEAARQRGLHLGLSSKQIKVIGLPVADRFCQPLGDRQALRNRFGWPTDLPVALLVGGGEGMGPIEAVAQAINQAAPRLALIVVTGRNRQLKARLEKHNWKIPTYVYGFVREMPEFMRAADMLITKAGPGTISEAFIAELPIILYSRIPGQEDGNVNYVVGEGAGAWAPEPEAVVNMIQFWLEHPEERQKAVEACRRLARPTAARQIARILVERVALSRETVHTEQGNLGPEEAVP